jgi:hypothetical protein
LDLEVYERGGARGLPSLWDVWENYFGTSRGKLNYAGNGYQKLRTSSRTRRDGDGRPGVSARYLYDALCKTSRDCVLPELTPEAMQSVLVTGNELDRFIQERLHDPRDPSIFRGPLLLVHKSPPAGAGRIRIAVSEEDVVFNETYYGYSAHEHPRGRQLVRYLALLIGSKPAFWYYLMTSGEFGFEREKVEKATIDGILLRPFEELDASALKEIEILFDAVAGQDSEQA